ncbi:MAG: filamentous hemagglutinin N-terminal domain-containing protein [Alphaproteobacteria bacterium]|nr:filamentous hemagglutinin N-terminal domain-containing protein [Alphaproteobacteria bacterium]MCW5744109.1 filamentous hemagglutinin N-terminal domain-containing protein [Alphaproteobacteria bacterium]
MGGQVSLLALAVGLGLVAVQARAQTLPTNGTVVSGSASITQPGAGQMTITQSTDRGVINWQSFSIGSGAAVTFQQPSASSATLNRVTGGMTSTIAGSLTANGQVFLVNPNGIQITPTGTVRTGSFVASTLDIRTDDFMARNLTFQGGGASAGVVNQGTIEVVQGGTVALIGGRVVNDGSIVADGGRVGLAAAERVVVDMQGDGFLQVSIPTADADRATALISHAGRIRANGGRVEMRAATTADVARNAINVPGTIEARTVARTSGGVVVFGDAPTPAGATVERGRVTIDGGAGGAVQVAGRITASGGTARAGGAVSIAGTSVALAGMVDVSGASGGAMSAAATGTLSLTGTVDARGLAGAGGTVLYNAAALVASASSVTDVSATTFGGAISADGGLSLNVSGTWLADGGANGGRIDLTADDVRVTSALLSATGGDSGGLIRIGGAFQGGAERENSPELEATFVTRWADAPDMRNATETRVYGTTTIDVSGGATGGTAVVWANGATWMAGTVNAGGPISAGSIEISGKENLAYIDLTTLTLGAGGHLLLDPKNITIAAGSGDPIAANDEFGENGTKSVSIKAGNLETLLNAGTDVTLQANNDITVSKGWTTNNGGGAGGDITLEAGRSVTFASGVSITTDDGSFTVIANTNNASLVAAQRDAGAALIDMRGLTLNAGTGAVSITMSSGTTTGDIRLGVVSSSGSITVAAASTSNLVELNGNLTTGGSIVLPDRNLVVRANSVLTSGAGKSVTWTGEATRTILGAAGGETIRFVEGTTVTRIGVMDTADAARLVLGPTSASRIYGDANPDVGVPALTSGALRGADTLSSLLVAGSTAVNYPGGTPTATSNVGDYAYTVSATGSTAFAAGKTGYFLTTSTVNGTLSVTARPITVTADPKTKVYGDADPALTYQITSGSLVGADTLSGALTRTPGETVAGGPYAILQGTLAASSNYALTYVGGDLTITARPVTVTADAKTKVYGDADPALTFTTSSLGTGTAIVGALDRAPGETVAGGPYAILQGTITNANNPNYVITYVGADLSITARPVTVTADAKTRVYGDADPALTFTTSSLGAGTAIVGALDRAPGETVAGGPYAILQGTITNANNPNYVITYVGADLSITARPVTVTADAKTKIYGDADPALTFTTSSLGSGTAIVGALDRAPGETVAGGPYAILQGTITNANNPNYVITYVGADLSITARPVTVTADAKTKVYGDADPALTFTTSSLGTGTAIVGALDRVAGETVAGGPYAILQGTITNANNPNYIITYVGADLSITARPVTVTADAKTKVYGDADPALTFTTSSLGTGTAIVGALDRAPGETVAGGPYAILQGTVTNANNPNYVITYVGADLTVTARPVTVTADAKTKVYGDADPALTFTTSSLGTGTAIVGSLDRVAGETVAGGPYAILQGTITNANNPNYVITYVGADLSITARPVTVTADAKTKVYGDADPALTFTTSSLGSGTAIVGALDRVAGETVAGGPYAILQGTITNANNPNYVITYVGADLSITARPVTVTADAKTKVYGDADPALTFTTSSLGTGTAIVGSLDRVAGETVAGGPYAILQGTITNANNPNYVITYVGADLSITARPVTVTADAQTKVYGDADPALTFTTSSLGTGVAIVGALDRTPGETVAGGPYAILQGTITNANNPNYVITYVGADLTVTARPVTVTADAKTKVYGDADPALTFTTSSLGSGTAIVGALDRTPGETVAGGPYAILQGTITNANNPNYLITYVGADLTITARPVTVTADAKTKVYGDADPPLTFTTSSLGSGTAIVGSLDRVVGETVAGGPYAILQGTVTNANNPNYVITYVGADLTITARPITVTADAKTKVYGDGDPALTYQVTSGSLVGLDTLSGALTRTAGETVAGGPYAILQGTITNANNPNYAITYVGADLSITARPVTVTADAKTKVYGDADPALTFTTSSLGTGTAIVGSLDRVSGETVAGGPYAILQGTVTNANNPNYVITYVGADLSITARSVTVTADAKTKVYGDADPALSFTTSSLGTGTAIVGALDRVAGETVAGGPYAILQGTITNANNPNYVITYVGADLTVTARPVTVTADAKTKVYGDADPALTFTTSSLGSGTAIVGALDRAPGETVAGGPYAILQGTITNANNPNYVITYVGADLTVTARPVTVTADAKTRVYGDADPALTFTTSSLGSGTAIVGALDRAPGETVTGGPYSILQGTVTNANNPNYVITYVGADLTITPRPITVTADSHTKVELLPDPAFTWQLTSGTVVFGDLPTGVLTRDPGDTPGTYAITQGSFTYGANYALTFVNGQLTITPRPTNPLPAIAGGTPGDGGNGVLGGLYAPSGGGTVRSGIFRDIDESGVADPDAPVRQTSAACLISPAGTLICPQTTP